MPDTAEPHFASIVWTDGSTTTATRDSRAEVEDWLCEEIERGGGDPNATAVLPESQRAANRVGGSVAQQLSNY